MANKVVRFVASTSWPRVYEAGDIASFDADMAYKLIQRGVAVDHTLDTSGPGGSLLVSPTLGGMVSTARDEAGEAGVASPKVLGNDEGAVAKGAWPYSPSLPGSDFSTFSGGAGVTVSTPSLPQSSPGGGSGNIADHTDLNNAYLPALMAA